MPAPPQPLTFFFSDIEGSTRLWEERPEVMRAALAQHDAVLKRCIEGQRGRIVKSTGDGVHAVFDAPAEALQAALQLQLALADAQATAGLALQVRCGLHLGSVEQRDGDYFGPAVNRAARIMDAAHGGQTLLSQACAESVADRLPADAALRDLGRVRLRNLASPEQVFQLLHPALRADFPPLRGLERPPTNLAQQLNSFVGRTRELAEVTTLLAGSRLLTLLGMGGIGKSRLSLQVAAELRDEHADGVWLVELAALTDPLLVPQALASVLAVKEDAGQGVTAALLRHVRDRELLLIFDNCEHVVHACADLIKQLLQAGPSVKVLASSRTMLQVAGETTYQVPTLAVPDPRRALPPEALAAHESVQLFVDRARAAHAGFALTPANASAVADICRQLDGIPLALELAAARTRALSAEAIASRLIDRFRLLTTGDRTVLPRQRTLRALIDWSHDLLSEPERLLFRRLAVFAGGWTVDAAEAVGADDALDSGDVLDVMVQLVEKSLVVMEPDGTRYRMLDTVRQYAQEQLDGSAEGPSARTRHLAFHLARAEAARPELAGPDQGVWLARLDLERENFLSAHSWSEHADGGDRIAVRLLHALRPYWIRRGSLSIGLRLAEELLQRKGLQQRDAARCMALFGAGQMSMFMGRLQEARRYLTECLAIARETNDSAIVARVLQPLGSACRRQGDFAAAGLYLEEALTRAHDRDDLRETAAAANALAMLRRMEGRFDMARPLCEDAINLARQVGDAQFVGIGLLNLAMVSISAGELTRARTMLLEATSLAEETGSQPLARDATEVCAGLAATQQQWAVAAAFYLSAESQRETAGVRRDPADEAFVAPLIAATRHSLGADAFDALRGPGAAGLGAVRQWLDDGANGGLSHQLSMSGSIR